MFRLFGLILTTLANVVTSNLSEDRLLETLLQSNKHNLLNIPLADVGDVLHVELGLVLKKIIKVDEVDEVLHTQFWLQTKWKDYRLKWNNAHFQGLNVTYIQTQSLWTPDISLYNNAREQTVGSRSPQSNFVRLYSDGTCLWWSLFEQSVSHCLIDVTWYPFDDQHCNLSFESWKYNSDMLNITATQLPELFFHYNTNEEWKLLGVDSAVSQVLYGCCEHFSRATFTLSIHRNPLYYVVRVLLPCCFMSFVAVFTYILQPSRTERLAIGMTILLTLSIYQISVYDLLPAKSSTLPFIGIYFVFITVLCFINVAVTIVIVHLYTNSIALHPNDVPEPVRKIVCQRLGSLFHFAKKPLSPYDSIQKNEHNVFIDRGFDNDIDPYNDLEAQPTRPGSLSDPVLVDIRELLQKKDRLEDEERMMTRRNDVIRG